MSRRTFRNHLADPTGRVDHRLVGHGQLSRHREHRCVAVHGEHEAEPVVIGASVRAASRELGWTEGQVYTVAIGALVAIVLALTGYRQTLAPHSNVTEVILKGWWWSHGASHSPAVWERECVAAKAKIPHAGKPIQGVHIASLRLRAFATWRIFFRTSRFFS